MNVEIFCVCDFASVERTGKMNVVGAFDTIHLQKTPATHDAMSIAVKLRVSPEECEEAKKIRISFLDDSGLSIIPGLETQVSLDRESAGPTAPLQIAVGLLQTRLPSFGRYSIQLEIENKLLASIPLYVKFAEPENHQNPKS